MLKKISIIFIYLLTIINVSAQDVSDYYHKAANLYINGSKKEAQQIIQEAVKEYPNDPKLRQLSSKVNKLPEDEKNKNQNQKQKQNQDQQDKKQQDQQDQQDNQQQKQRERNQPSQPKPKPQSQMSKQNAQQILDALQQDEKNTQDKAKKQLGRGTRKAEKDW